MPAVTPLTLFELCLAFPAMTPQHCCDARRPIARLHTRRSRAPPAGVKYMCTRRVKSGRCVKSMNPKNTKKSMIHENADANITCDFGSDGDISRLGVANQTHCIHIMHVYTNKHRSFISSIRLIDGSTDRRCFAIVTNVRALLSKLGQPVRKVIQTPYCVFRRVNKRRQPHLRNYMVHCQYRQRIRTKQ